jgi:biopolymer transport protein ExbB
MNETTSAPDATGSGPAAMGLSLDQIGTRAEGLLDAGGPVVAILFLVSILALAIVLLKLYQFRSARVGRRRFIAPALTHVARGETDEALALLVTERNPIARVLETAIRGQIRVGVAEATLREEVVRVANFHLERLRSYLRALEVIGTLSPLLGLFGTVLGMIAAFKELEAAGNQVNASLLSRGIWEALLTTAVGLTVAIPTVAVATWLERHVDRLAHDMEDAATRVFTIGLSREQTQAPSRQRAGEQESHGDADDTYDSAAHSD